MSYLPFDPPRHVVALSGGKDSTALALALHEKEPRDYDFLITPTGNELPEMQLHWAKLEGLLGKEFIRPPGPQLVQLIEFHNALPNNRMRWCTRQLKIEPALAWARRNAPVIMYVGLRADEETREGIYGDAVTCDYPFQRWRWGLEDVLRCLRRRSITVPERTDCAWCYDQQLIEWYRLWLNHRDVWNEGKEHEARTGKTFRSPSRDTWPAALAEMEKEFEAGRIPQVRASRGGGTCRVCSL